VDEFLELTAIANPHARITFVPPSRDSGAEVEEELEFRKGKGKASRQQGAEASSEGKAAEGSPLDASMPGSLDASPAEPQVTTETGGVIVFPRAVEELPPETKEIMPHPKGIELGILLQMLKEAEQEERGYTLYNFLQDKFSRVSASTAGEFCKAVGLTSRTKVSEVEHETAERLFKVLQDSKLPPPPTDCLAPIGVQQMLKGMFKGVRAEFYAASSREPDVYRGRPFLIEAAIAFGGELPTEDTARVIRFANRVPLLFQQSACSSFKAVTETNWRNYDLQHPKGGVPVGPIVIMIHMASVWVPFTSESKEAIADYDEIRKEMKLALMECGRKLGTYLRKRLKMKREAERRDVFERYIGEISKAINAINGTDAKKLYDALLAQAKKRTAVADLKLDDEGKNVKEQEEEGLEDGVIIVDSGGGTGVPPVSGPPEDGKPSKGGAKRPKADGGPAADPFTLSKSEAARLKVAALQNADDQPTLLDVDPVKRSPRKGKPAPAPSSNGSTNGTHKKSSKDGAPSKKVASPTPPAPAAEPAGKPKPKMRLVNGKLVPVEEGPKLF
jgi:DNA topoisomerase-6 subunit B